MKSKSNSFSPKNFTGGTDWEGVLKTFVLAAVGAAICHAQVEELLTGLVITIQKCRKIRELGCVNRARAPGRESRNLVNLFSCISVYVRIAPICLI